MSLLLFNPFMGSTVSLNVGHLASATTSVSVPTGANVVSICGSGASSADIVFISFSDTATTADLAIPINSVSPDLIRLPNGVTDVAGITLNGNATVYFTFGTLG